MGTQSTLVAQVSQPTYWDQAIGPPDIAFPEYPAPSPLDEYLFDPQAVRALAGGVSQRRGGGRGNAVVDSIPKSLERREWWGNVQREDHPEHRGRSYQQIYESGPAFEMSDRPSQAGSITRFRAARV